MAKRNDLSLKMKYEVIKTSEREPKLGIRTLAEHFQCGKTQISTILKNKKEVRELYESNASSGLCQARKRNRMSEYADLNDALFQWYQMCVQRNIYPDGSLLAEKALTIAERLGHTGFKASNGWLHRWKVRNNIKQRTVSGESGDVRSDTNESWKERLPQILEGYKAEDIWNVDETGCFWKALPDKGLGQMKAECKGGKKSKHRVTIAFFVNGVGQSEFQPVVIWKSKNPRCFKGVRKESLPVRYYSQPKSWMTGDILHDILGSLNRKLRAKGRSILLFMDNAGCHPTDLEGKYSNIRVLFLPPNTTSKLQPLDLGIIQNFKLYYRKMLMRFILAKIEECTSASDVVKSLTVLHAIRWIAQAWSQVSPEVIKKCFRKAGILNQSLDVVSREVPTEDPFLDLDDQGQVVTDEEVQHLINQLQVENPCSADELASIDDDLAVCADLSDDHWEEDFLAEIGPSSSKSLCTEDTGGEKSDVESESDEEESADLPRTRFHNLPEAIACLEDVREFLEFREYTCESTETMSLISSLTTLHSQNLIKSTRQSSLLEFFTS
jgi:hypothetical protein